VMLGKRLVRGPGRADVFGRLGVSTASAWSVLLSMFGQHQRYAPSGAWRC
jgi:hypothetical protein